MKCLYLLSVLLFAAADGLDRDVPSAARAEIARRGTMVERVDGIQDAADATDAVAAAMQPPADDSAKWLFTLVTTRNCQWCDKLRADFENDPLLKAWVDTKDYTKSWAHWQVVQIEDRSQAWRWKDFKPTAFPALIVQPPVNGSWGDPHTIVYVRQGYAKPAEIDAAIRKAIQLYAPKAFSQRLAWQAKQSAMKSASAEGSEHAGQAGGHDQALGGWTPPVTPPQPLPPLPSYPNQPTTPSEYPPLQPNAGGLLAQLVAVLFGAQGTANLLLLAILLWQIYRTIARKEGIPLLIDDETAGRLIDTLESLKQPQSPTRPAGG